MLKRIMNRIIRAQARVGQLRAATYLSQMGYYEDAKKVMLKEI